MSHEVTLLEVKAPTQLSVQSRLLTGGSETMQGPSKVKFAIGLFAEAKEVGQALAELQTRQWPMHQVKVIATQDSLEQTREFWRLSGGEPGVCSWIVCRAAQGECPWQFDLVGSRTDSSLKRINPLPGFSHWVPDRQARQLDEHLRAGGELLVIRSSSVTDERDAWATLLRHARRGFQTHEVSFKHLR
jgi:hypothetical protein